MKYALMCAAPDQARKSERNSDRESERATMPIAVFCLIGSSCKGRREFITHA